MVESLMKIQEVLYALVTVGLVICTLISFTKRLVLLGVAVSLLAVGRVAFLVHDAFWTFSSESHAVLSVFQDATSVLAVLLIMLFLSRCSKRDEKEVQQTSPGDSSTRAPRVSEPPEK